MLKNKFINLMSMLSYIRFLCINETNYIQNTFGRIDVEYAKFMGAYYYAKLNKYVSEFECVYNSMNFRQTRSGKHSTIIIPNLINKEYIIDNISYLGMRYSTKCYYKRTNTAHIFLIPKDWKKTVLDKGISVIGNRLIVSAEPFGKYYKVIFCSQGRGCSLNTYSAYLSLDNHKFRKIKKVYNHDIPKYLYDLEYNAKVEQLIDVNNGGCKESVDYIKNYSCQICKYLYDPITCNPLLFHKSKLGSCVKFNLNEKHDMLKCLKLLRSCSDLLYTGINI